MDKQKFEDLVRQYENRKRKGSEDSDCAIVDKMWRIYWNNQKNDLGCTVAKWLLKRIPDQHANKLAKRRIYEHFFLNRNSIPKKHKKLFRSTLKELPKKKRKKIKRVRT